MDKYKYESAEEQIERLILERDHCHEMQKHLNYIIEMYEEEARRLNSGKGWK